MTIEEQIDKGHTTLNAARDSIMALAREASRLAPDTPDLLFWLAQSVQPLSFTDPAARAFVQRARRRLDELGGPSRELLRGDANVIGAEIHNRRLVEYGLATPASRIVESILR